ncbi:hypothetical protein PG996_012539 [Apiospora saccharicola]|uniref:Rhodopsin domain-containing protein n=1 Tax=Apiospora saccharicola TaxID=335842 RepID=A0ABR1U5M9_9PEZI
MSDIWLVLAALCVLGLVICDTITYRMGRMADPTSSANVELRKIWFAMNYLFDAGLYLPKLSMVAIYYHLIPMHFHMLRRALHFIGFFVGSAFFITFFSDTFWCGPHPSVQWWPGPHSCSAFESKTLMQLNWSLCFSCEALLFVLPFPLLSSITSLSGREKAGLVGIFTLGAVTIGVSSGRFATMMMKGNDISLWTWNLGLPTEADRLLPLTDVWNTTEFSVSIMIVAATALRPLIRKAWEATTFTSKHSNSGSGRHRPKFFKGGSGGTGDSMWELKPALSSSSDPPHPLQRQTSPSSWQDHIISIAEEGGYNGGDIPLRPMSPTSQTGIVKTKRFSISSGHQPVQPVSHFSMDLESGRGGNRDGSIWDGQSRVFV